MITRHKLATGIGGLVLMLGTVGGAVAVNAAAPTASPPAIVQPAQAGAPQAQQGTQVEDTTPDTGTEATAGPDTDNIQDGSGSQVEDGTPDIPVAVTP